MPLGIPGVGSGEPKRRGTQPQTSYKMVFKCVFDEKHLKTIMQQLFYKPFCRKNFKYLQIFQNFINHSVRLNHFWINEFTFSQKKTTNHFVGIFVVFWKVPKPFSKGNPNLWPNLPKNIKPFSSIPCKKKIRCFSFFWKKLQNHFVKLFST